MSRWRCGYCNYIIDNNWLRGDKCPRCKRYEPDEKWVEMGHDACEAAWYRQQWSIKKYQCSFLMDRVDILTDTIKAAKPYLLNMQTLLEPFASRESTKDLDGILNIISELEEEAKKKIIEEAKQVKKESDIQRILREMSEKRNLPYEEQEISYVKCWGSGHYSVERCKRKDLPSDIDPVTRVPKKDS